MKILIPVSVGEIFDRLSILHIKLWLIKDIEKKEIVNKEINMLEDVMGENLSDVYISDEDYLQLVETNKKIWNGIEISNKWITVPTNNLFEMLERNKVYNELNVNNNKRFELKRKINERFNSDLKEVKSHI